VLWAICPLLIHWVTRIRIQAKAKRRELAEDPVLFALRDHVSWLVVAGVASVIFVAWLGR
jgi:hypothetical protein